MSVTPDEVRGIINTDLTDEQIQNYITTAELLVNTYFADCDYSDEVIHQMELYMTAYLINNATTTSNQSTGIQSEKVGDAEVTYAEVKSGAQDLSGDLYGKVIVMFDTNNCLQNKKQRLNVRVFAIPQFED